MSWKFSIIGGAYGENMLYQAFLVLGILCESAEAVATGLHQLRRINALQNSNLWQTPLSWQPRTAAKHGHSILWVLYGLRCQLSTTRFCNLETSPSCFTQVAWSMHTVSIKKLANWNGLGTNYGSLVSFPVLHYRYTGTNHVIHAASNDSCRMRMSWEWNQWCITNNYMVIHIKSENCGQFCGLFLNLHMYTCPVKSLPWPQAIAHAPPHDHMCTPAYIHTSPQPCNLQN